ncbi:unnamed protein product, partial [Phaeothamnion confervicola]
DPRAYEHYLKSDFKEYYQVYFPHYRGEPVVGDCNPRKLTFPWSLRLLQEQMPGGKIVILIRNPCDRAFSEWWMDFYAGSEKLNFEEAIQENLKYESAGLTLHDDEATALKLLQPWFESRYRREPQPTRALLGTGYYWKGIERAQKLFTPERVKVVLLEALQENPQGTLRDLLEFLEVRSDINLCATKLHNEAFGELSRKAVSLARCLKVPKMFSYGNKEKLLKSVGSLFSALGDKKPVLQKEMRNFLDAHYREHNRRLVELTGLDLTAWKSGLT